MLIENYYKNCILKNININAYIFYKTILKINRYTSASSEPAAAEAAAVAALINSKIQL